MFSHRMLSVAGRVLAVLASVTLIGAFAATPVRAVDTPTFAVNPNSVMANGWPSGATLIVTVDGLSGSWQGVADTNGNVGIQMDGYVRVVGQLVRVTDGTTAKTHTVRPVSITGADKDADTVSGTGTPGGTVQVWIFAVPNDPSTGVSRHPTVTAGGTWVADFKTAGPAPDDKTIDIVEGTGIQAQERDEEGDATTAQYQVPNPRFQARRNAGGNGTSFIGWEFKTGPGTLTVSGDGGFSKAITFDGSGWFQDEQPGLRIGTGQVVSVTDGATTKDLIVPNLGITSVDIDTNVVSGTATPDQPVTVYQTSPESPSWNIPADEDGNWSVDFDTPPPGENPVDLVRGMGVEAAEADVDGDRMLDQYRIPAPAFRASPNPANDTTSFWGWDFKPGDGTITLSGPGSFNEQIELDGGGGFWFDREGFVIQPGDLVTVTDGVTTKGLIYARLTIDAPDVDADTVSGSADPRVAIHVSAWDNEAGAERDVTADDDGHWVADFGVADPDSQTYDINPGTDVDASRSDGDGDQSAAMRHVANPTFRVDLENRVEGWEWPPDTMMTNGAGPNRQARVETSQAAFRSER